MKQKLGRKLLSFLLTLAMVVGLMPGMGLTAYAADEVSENISLVNGQSLVLGTHYSVSGEFENESGIHVYNKGPMTINARKGETITKVVLTYSWGNYKSSLSASPGAFDGDATISDINAQQVTISSSDTRGVKISAVTVYFEGSLSNPTVTLTGGANAKSSGGLLTQSYLPGAMDTVTYTALTGATFPEFETFTQNGVTVERTSDTVVTVSGTPTANTEITVPDAESSSKIVTWGSSIINDSGKNGLEYQIRRNNSYSDTANGITLTKSGDGKVGSDDWYSYGSLELNFTTATGKFTSIEIETSQILDGGNWTKDGNKLKWNGTPSNSVSLSGSRLYLGGVSSVNFVIEMPTVSVTITPGSNMTKTTDSGAASQTGLSGAMTPVVYTANEGYYFPTDYSVAEVSGIKVTRNSYTQITVSGTPTGNAEITLTAPTAKTTPGAPTTVTATDCTTAANNDGKLTGVTAEMEYKKSDATEWTAGTGSDITGLVPGTYYVRIKATDTTNASGNQELTITDYLSVTKTAAKADLDTLLGTKTESDYDAADWTTLTQAIANGKTAIENATTTDAVATAKSTAVDAVNAVKTKAQKALENAKTSAVNTVNAVNANDYIAADQQTVTDAKTTALAAIEAATTEEEVTTALNNFNNAIASCTTQVVADQIAQVMSEVSAKTGSDMTYTGSPIQLINTPTTALPAGYTMKYAVTTENVKPTDESLYTTSIPAKTDVGTYYVWYKVVGDENHNDSEAACVEATIAEQKPEAKPEQKPEEKPEEKTDAVVTTAPKAKKLTYNSKAQALVNAGKATGGTMQYALGNKTKATGSYSDSIPTGTKAGTYYVWYKVVGDENHNDSKAACVKVTIAEAQKEQKPFTDFRTLRLVAKRGTKSVNLTWRKYDDADGYLIYGCECGEGSKMKLLKTIKGNKTVKWTHKNLKKATYYKYKVVAYKNVKGKKKTLVTSKEAHTVTHDGKTTAVEAVKVNKTSVSLNAGQTFQIKASETKENKNKKIDHHREISYESSNKKVATVNKNGKVKGVKKGTATIFVYSETGHYKTVKVTVK